MEINVYNYKSVLKNHSITSSDRLIFEISKGNTLVYNIHPTFLNFSRGLNDAIFTELGLDKHSVSEQVYGSRRYGDFPEFNTDYERDNMIRFLFDTLAKQRGLIGKEPDEKSILDHISVKLNFSTELNLSIKL